jgi:hypothetical protein
MNFGFFYFLGAIMIFILLGLSGYFIWLATREKGDAKNRPIITNMMNSYSDGYGFGIVDKKETSIDRTKVKILPRDIDYDKVNEEGLKLEPKTVIVKNHCFIPLGNSTRRESYLILPDKAEDFNATFKNHPLMPFISMYLEDQAHKGDLTQILRRRLENNKSILLESEGLDIVKDYFEKVEELNKDATKSARVDTPQKKEE